MVAGFGNRSSMCTWSKRSEGIGCLSDLETDPVCGRGQREVKALGACQFFQPILSMYMKKEGHWILAGFGS